MNTPVIAKANDPATTIRFPDGLMKKIKVEASRNGRSFNTEVIKRLADSLQKTANHQAA